MDPRGSPAFRTALSTEKGGIGRAKQKVGVGGNQRMIWAVLWHMTSWFILLLEILTSFQHCVQKLQRRNLFLLYGCVQRPLILEMNESLRRNVYHEICCCWEWANNIITAQFNSFRLWLCRKYFLSISTSKKVIANVTIRFWVSQIFMSRVFVWNHK